MQEARTITGLEIKKGSVFNLEFLDKEFDVVFTNALFCMLEPHLIEKAFREIMRVANKYIVLMELKTSDFVGMVSGGRTGANWPEMFKKYGLTATERKLTQEEWPANPWIDWGYAYVVDVKKNAKTGKRKL